MRSSPSKPPPEGALTSPRNPRVLAARKLLRARDRKREGAFLLEGLAAVLDALEHGARLRSLFVAGRDEGTAVEEAAATAGVEVIEVGADVASSLSSTVTPQGIVAVAESPVVGLESLPPSPSLVLVLAGVRDPGNAGTLLRSAAAAGADAVVFSDDSVDPLNPKVVRSSAASLFLVPVVADAPVEEAMAILKERDCNLLGADSDGRAVYETDLTRPLGLVVGNEAHGLPGSVRDLLDGEVSVPMPGPTESLNAGIAGSLLLFEAVRQRRMTG